MLYSTRECIVRTYWRERAYTFFMWFNGCYVWISSSCLLPNVVYKLPIQSNPLECYETHNQFKFHIFALMSLKTATYFYRSKNIYYKQCISHKFYRISREFSRFISVFVMTRIVWTIDKYMTNECRKWHFFVEKNKNIYGSLPPLSRPNDRWIFCSAVKIYWKKERKNIHRN